MSTPRPRSSSDRPWKRISLRFSKLSTMMSLDATPDSSVPVKWPQTPSETRESSRTLLLRFRVKATAAFGCTIAVVGSTPELGEWALTRRLALTTKPGEYPMWTSAEVLLPAAPPALEYKYVYIEKNGTCVWERRIPNRRIETHFAFTEKIRWTLVDTFEEASSHVIDARARLPLLARLPEAGSLYDHLQELCSYFESRGADSTLEDYLCACHLFRYWAAKGTETESKQSLELMLQLAERLMEHMTPEIELIIRDTIANMAQCSIPFWKVTHSVLDSELVDSGDVPLGCHSGELFEFLTDFLNASKDSDSLAKVVVLNSVRRCLRKLRERSSTPDLLFMYDVCLEELERTYVQHFQPDASGLLTSLHRLTLVLESLELSGICADECSAYCGVLNAVWRSHEDMGGHLESIKGLLVEVVHTFTRWVAKYSNVIISDNGDDVLDLKALLTVIAKTCVCELFPNLSSSLYLVDSMTSLPLYCPVKTGTAEGKVVRLSSLAELPDNESALIAIVSNPPTGPVSLPESLQALVLLKDIDLRTTLVSDCIARSIALAVAAPELIPERVEKRSQVHIFEDSLDFV